jgi:hypothetical protein
VAQRVVSGGRLPYPFAVDVDWSRYSSARVGRSWRDPSLPLLSSLLLRDHAEALAAPVFELTAQRAVVVTGFLRACRRADALAVVAIAADARRHAPTAAERIVDGMVATAVACGHDRPLVVVARADRTPLWHAPTLNAAEAVLERVAHDVDAGFNAIGLDVACVGDSERCATLLRALDEEDVGLELEVDTDEDVALLLAEIDDQRLPLAAVRGANLHDDVGQATRIVTLNDLRGVEYGPGGLRVNLDDFVAAAIARAGAVGDAALEQASWTAVMRALDALKAHGTVSRLAEALVDGDKR